MTSLFKFWGWVKLNAAMLGIFAAVLTLATFLAYREGHANGKAACEAKYEAEKAKGYAAVVAELTRIDERNAQLVAQWKEQNRLTNEALEREVTNTYKVTEKIIEKPVPVAGDCSIDYSIVGVLNDAARGSTDGN